MYMTVVSLLHHYFEYLRSPAVLLAILAVVGPISLELFKNNRLASERTATKIPGCFRLGKSKRSNLDDQYVQTPAPKTNTDSARIKALFTYPVKSCRGVELAASEVASTGLKYDRLFTFARLRPKHTSSTKGSTGDGEDSIQDQSDLEWRFITQREFPRLASIETELWLPKPDATRTSGRLDKAASARKKPGKGSVTKPEDQMIGKGGWLIIRFPVVPKFNFFGLRNYSLSLSLPLAPGVRHMQSKEYDLEPLSIWTDHTQAINVTKEIAPDDWAKLAAFLGASCPLGLFRIDHTNTRKVTRSLPKDGTDRSFGVGFADAFPCHVLNLASVRAQDAEMPEKSALKGKLDARRFRANVYVTGPPAYEEDTWKKVRMGRCVKPHGGKEANDNASHARSAASKTKAVVEAEGEYHVACRTARCKMPNVDQDTGVRDVHDPFSTLRKTRQVDEGAFPHPCLGMQMIPLFEQGILRVGDEIRVLERGEHVYEKMFP